MAGDNDARMPLSSHIHRVFSHALNTVNKIRTGSQKPPSATRLRLYGLYKQAMEGDVDGIMDRPEGSSEQDLRAREKWDAWKQQNSLSRTEAKRRYITTLIDTMHQYASPSPDSRELVAELEFVWDQVKSNVPSSSSSSPLQTLDQVGTGMSASYSALERQRQREDDDDYSDHGGGGGGGDDGDDRPLQIKSPMSQSEEDLEAAEAELDRDEFVDAPDSQYALDLYRRGEMDHNLSEAGTQPPSSRPLHRPGSTPSRPRMRTIMPQPIPLPPSWAPNHNRSNTTNNSNNNSKNNNNDTDNNKNNNNNTNSSSAAAAADAKWRTRVESSLMKMTAEVAALREQLEARRLFQHRAHYRLLRAAWRLAWAAVKHVAVDVVLLVLVLGWLRRRGDRRAEGAVRVLLGDAVAQLQGGRLGGVALASVPVLGKLPGLGGGGKG
ncbi:Autophagy-related protein 37 [Stagonosporopsis vannaccii]|nr:Autophagy-related protein 37 [Stagonosporopsis vannaccii]